MSKRWRVQLSSVSAAGFLIKLLMTAAWVEHSSCQCEIKSNISWLCVFVCVYIIRLQQMRRRLSAVTLLINSVEMLPATHLTNTQPTPQTRVNINNLHRWHRFTGTAGLREGFMYQSASTHINLFLWQIMRSIINTCAWIISTVKVQS